MSIPAGCRRCAQCYEVKPLRCFAYKAGGTNTKRRGVCTTCAPPEPDRLVQSMCKGKNRYGSHGQALAVAQKSARHTFLIRVYECPICQGWHLTKKPEWVTS